MSTDRRYGVIAGLGVKAPCVCATTAPITLSGLQTVDGIVLVAGDRVLVKNQVDTTTNGIYAADTSTWTRDVDFDGQLDVVQGTCVIVAQGSTNANVAYQLLTANPVIIGTSSLTFAANPYLSTLAASSGSSMVGFSHTPAATAGTVGAKLQQTIDIRDAPYNAVSGADNTAAITAAIAAATTGAGTKINLCASLISSTVIVNKTDIIFESNLAPLSYAAGFVGSGTYPTYDNMFIVTANNVHFQNTTIKQGAFTPSPTMQRTVWYDTGVDGGSVHNCRFEDDKYIAVMVTAGASNISVKDNYFKNCAASVVLSGNYGMCEGNTSENTNSTGASDSTFSINGGTGNTIRNNLVVKTAATTASGDIIDITNTVYFTVTGNTIYGLTGGNGIYVWDAGVGYTSTTGIIADNTIDGAGLTATALWAMIAVTAGTGIQIKNNILKNPPTISGTCFGILAQTGNNVISGNDIQMGSVAVNAGIGVNGDAGSLDIVDNKIYCPNRGINFLTTTNNGMVPIILRGNEYGGTMVFAYDNSNSTLLQNVPIWIENEKYLSASIIYWNIPKYGLLLGYYSSAQLPFSLKDNAVMYSVTTPLAGTWKVGDSITNAVPAVGQPKGWVCTVAGTYSAATEAGTATSGSPIITAMADTSDFFVGDYVDASAQFAVLTRLTILSKTATTITVNRNANGSGACTLSTTDPTWVSTGNL